MITVTAQALQMLRRKSWEGTPEEESLEATSENRHRLRRWCRRDYVGADCSKYRRRSKEEGPIADDEQPCTTDIQRQSAGSRSKESSGLEIGRVLELIGEIQRCCPVETLVHKNSKFELDPLWRLQPVHRQREHKPRGRVYDRLQTSTECPPGFALP